MDQIKRVLKEAEGLARYGQESTEKSTPEATSPPVLPFFSHPDYLKKQTSIPDKMAFKIGEVADLLGVKQYVLRYWETEFEELKPKKGSNNQRMYSRKNVERALMIQHLLHVERFSIEGARNFMRKRREEQRQVASEGLLARKVQELRKTATEIQNEVYSLRLKIDSIFRSEA